MSTPMTTLSGQTVAGSMDNHGLAVSAPPTAGTDRLAARHPPWRTRLHRLVSWVTWRYRYLGVFVIIGFLSICLEVAIVLVWNRLAGPSLLATGTGFVTGMLVAFFGNYYLNFRVDGRRFWLTFGLFAAISVASFSMNLVAKDWLHWLNWHNYPDARFLTSGGLGLIAYVLHRRFTFRHAAKNLGLAVYAAADCDPQHMFARIGEHCDHIHIDLVDDTMKPDALPVDPQVIRRARMLWTWQPFILHVMSRRPSRWLDACLDQVDAVLFHLDLDEDLMEHVARCRLAGKEVGVVAQHGDPMSRLLPWFPHVDYVLILGIERPGYSGQTMVPGSLVLAERLVPLAQRYGFRLIFDGGVTVDNVNHIPTDLIVSSSTVLRAENPAHAALALMTGRANAHR